MKALLIIAHGSRREASNEEIRRLSRQLSDNSQHDYDLIECAFLELATPNIPQGLEALIKNGAHDIRIVPYFLAAGRHVTEDIPREIQKVVAAYPAVKIMLKAHIGSSEKMTGLIVSLSQGRAS